MVAGAFVCEVRTGQFLSYLDKLENITQVAFNRLKG